MGVLRINPRRLAKSVKCGSRGQHEYWLPEVPLSFTIRLDRGELIWLLRIIWAALRTETLDPNMRAFARRFETALGRAKEYTSPISGRRRYTSTPTRLEQFLLRLHRRTE